MRAEGSLRDSGIKHLQAIGGGKYIEHYKGGEQLGGKFKVLSHNSVKDSTEINGTLSRGFAHAANALRLARQTRAIRV